MGQAARVFGDGTPSEYVTRSELADKLGVTEDEIIRLLDAGKLPQSTGRLLRGKQVWYLDVVEAFITLRDRQLGSVYFIGFGGYVKIGFTRGAIQARVDALQTGAPEKLSILAVIDASTQKENELHYRFASARSYGEWFHLTPEIQDYIDEVRDAST